jgi:hypothetical protein
MSPDQAQERRRQLQQAYQADFHLLIRCGHCPNRRLLDELAEESMLRFYLRAFGEGNPAWIAGVDSLA